MTRVSALEVAVAWMVCAFCGTAGLAVMVTAAGAPPAVLWAVAGLCVLVAAAAGGGLCLGREPWRGRAHVAGVTVLATWLLTAAAAGADRFGAEADTTTLTLAAAAPVAVGVAAAVVLGTARVGAKRQINHHVTEHVLYRFYDVYEQLLYVGRTSQVPRRRFAQHRGEKEWWGDVAVRELTYWPTPEALEEAERQAIRHERPRHNKVRYEVAS